MSPGDSGTATNVDITSLESAAVVLEHLRDYVNRKLIGEPAAKLQVGDDTDLVFGGFAAAKEIAGKHQAFYTAVSGAYSAVEKSLKDTIDGTQRIIENYKTVEERNHASVQDIAKLLAGGERPSAPPAATSTTYASSPQAGPTSPSDQGGF